LTNPRRTSSCRTPPSSCSMACRIASSLSVRSTSGQDE
jgi:hypothetical protein